jgi:hypothetical protein
MRLLPNSPREPITLRPSGQHKKKDMRYELHVNRTYFSTSVLFLPLPTLMVVAHKHDKGPEWHVFLGFLFWTVELDSTHE